MKKETFVLPGTGYKVEMVVDPTNLHTPAYMDIGPNSRAFAWFKVRVPMTELKEAYKLFVDKNVKTSVVTDNTKFGYWLDKKNSVCGLARTCRSITVEDAEMLQTKQTEFEKTTFEKER